MITLGTTGAFGFEDFPQPKFLELYAAAGCDRVQIYRNREKQISAEQIRAICDSVPIRIDSLHAHFGDDLDPSSEDESVRKWTTDFYLHEAEFCHALGGNMMVIHPSPAHAPAGNIERRYSQLSKSLEDFARLWEKTGVICAVENMPPYHPTGPDVGRMVDAIAELDTPGVGFLLDFGHAHITWNLPDAIRRAGKHLRFTHVHDNDKKTDSHDLPYRGTADWVGVRQALHDIGYSGVFLLEVFEPVENLKMMQTPEWQQNIRSILGKC